MTDTTETTNRIESLTLTVIFTVISVALLAVIGIATRTGPEAAGWWTRPALAPGVTLVVMVLANVGSLLKSLADLRRAPLTDSEKTGAFAMIFDWFRPVEFILYFAGYVAVLQVVGYYLATTIFMLWLCWRKGLTTRGWILSAIATAIGMTLIFRGGLNIWMPRPWLFDLLPTDMARFAARWL